MAITNTDIPQLVFNKMSTEKYEELKTAGQLVENEFYITPDINGYLIGQFVQLSCSTDYIPDGCLPCNGSEYLKDMFQIFWTKYLVTGKLNTCTYEEYASEISTNGFCEKFAIDTVNNKFKTPTLTNTLYQGVNNTVPVVGNGDYLNITLGNSNEINPIHSFGGQYNDLGVQGSSVTGDVKITTDPTKSGIIADTSILAKEASVRYFVVVANSYSDTSVVDWSAYITALNNKANIDLSNVLENIDYVIERGQSEDGSQWYRKWKSGFIEQWGEHSALATVTLLIPFSNTSYNVQVSRSVAGGNESTLSTYNRTVSTFYIHNMWASGGTTDTTCCWYAFGY